MKKLNRLFKIFLSFLMVFSTLNMSGFEEVNAATTQVYFPKAIDFISSVKSFKTPNGFQRDAEGSSGHYIISNKSNSAGSGDYVYCIEPGVSLGKEDSATSSTSASKLFKSDSYTTAEKKKELIGLLAGRSSFTKEWEGSTGWKEKTRYLAATALIWEIVGGARKSDFTLVSGYSLKNIYTFKSYTDGEGVTYSPSDIKEYFDQYYDKWVTEVQNVIKEQKLISYADGSLHELIYNEESGRFEKEFEDKNKVTTLFGYAYSEAQKVGSSKSSDGNTITFKSYVGIEIPKDDPITVTFTGKTKKIVSSLTGWIPSSGHQKIISFGSNTTSDIQCTLKLYTGEIPSTNGKIEIYKKDKDGKAISNVTFELYSKDDNSLIDTIVTDSAGYGISKEIPLGKYYLLEKDARGGIIISPSAKDVELTEDNLKDGLYYKTVNITNDVAEGSITVYKEAEIVKSFSKDTMQFTYEKAKLPGMKFKISALEDIIDPRNGKTVYKKWETVFEGKTGTDGKATVKGLLPGKYTVIETESPEGTVLNDYHYDVNLGPADNVTQQFSKNVTVTNQRQPVEITVNKTDDKGTALSGSEFKVYTAQDIKDRNGNVIVSKDTAVASLKPELKDSKATAKVSGLPYGNYYVKEVKAPAGFELDDTKYEAAVKSDQTASKYPFAFDVVNRPKLGKIRVQKYDPILNKDFKIDGVEISLKANKDIINPADGSVLYKAGHSFGSKKTDINGVAEFTGLYPGEYEVKEVKGRKGYIFDPAPRTVTLEADTANTVGLKTVPIPNESAPLVGKLEIIKKGENGELLAGAEFMIRAAEKVTDPTGDVKYYDKGAVVAEGIRTDSTGTAVYYKEGNPTALPDGTALPNGALHPGKYEVIETKAPPGHKLDSTPHPVVIEAPEVADTNKIIEVELNVINYPSGVEISKQDATTGKELPGATMQVIDPSTDKIVEEWTSSDKPHIIKGLVIGKKYRLVEKLAPYGYIKAADVEFTVQDTKEMQKVVMKDEIVQTTITVNKTGKLLTAYENGKFIYKEIELEGIQFVVKAKEDIISLIDGKTVLYRAGEEVAALTTDSKGRAATDKLPLGTYTITEIKTKDGLIINSAPQTLEVRYKDQNTKTINAEVNFTNERQTVDLTLIKKDSLNSNVIPGVIFNLTAKNDIRNYLGNVIVKAGTVLETAATGKDGKISFRNDLPVGIYEAIEVEPPKGYASTDETIIFDAESKDNTTKVITAEKTFKNVPTSVSTSKQDATTGKEIPGAVLSIIDKQSGLTVDTWTSEDRPHITNYLEAGKTYILKEILAPYGYLLANEVEFTVQDTKEIQKVTMKDELAVGKIIVTKTGEVATQFKNPDKLLGFENGKIVYENRLISGVEFDIFAQEDITAPNGQIIYTKDTKVDSITTDNKGEAKSKDLPLGIYYVVESKAAEGFVLDDTPMTAELKYKDQVTPVVYGSVSLVNRRQSTNISVIKKDFDTKEVLEGAEFTISAKNDIKNYLGDIVIPKGTDIETAVTGKDGTARFTADLPLGVYEVRETKAPIGYASTDKVIEIDARSVDSTKEIVVAVGEIENKITTIQISKIDITNEKELPGATLEVRDENGSVIDRWISTDRPHTIKGLEVGKTYILSETRPADGYVTAEEIRFTISDTGDIQTVVMKDDITTIVVSKTDITGEKEIPGCELVITDSKGNIVDSWISEDTPHTIVKLTVEEEYILSETRPADGYVTAESIRFTVRDTGEVQKVVMKDDTTKIELSKKTLTGEDELEGATLELSDKDGKVIEKWVSGKEAHMIEAKLVVGEEYVLSETRPADGYVTAESIRFTVRDTGEVQKVVMKDAPTKILIEKLDNDGNFVEGAELQIIDKDTDEIVKEFTAGNEATLSEAELVVGKVYILREIAAPEGFVRALDVEFTVKDTGDVQLIRMVDKVVTALKADAEGNAIAGATMQVISAKTKNVVDQWVTDGNVHIINGLEIGGNYLLREAEAPEGFVRAEDVLFTVNTDNEVQSVTMIDKKVTVTKVDITNGKELPGAEMTVNEKETGEEIDRWISTEEPHEVRGLEEGKTYILTEAAAPEGYYTAESIEFTVDSFDEDGIKTNQQITVEDAPILTDIQVNKVDSQTNNAILNKDFRFTLYADKECRDEIMTVSADIEKGCAVFEDLRYGTYYIKETAAPKGYKLSSEIKEVIINDELENVGEIYSFEYQNTLMPVIIIETGDNNRASEYFALASLSLFGLYIFFTQRKKEEI